MTKGAKREASDRNKRGRMIAVLILSLTARLLYTIRSVCKSMPTAYYLEHANRCAHYRRRPDRTFIGVSAYPARRRFRDYRKKRDDDAALKGDRCAGTNARNIRE